MNFKSISSTILLLFLSFQVTSCDWAASRRMSLDLNNGRINSKTVSADVASYNMEKALQVINEIMNKYRLEESEPTPAQKEMGGIKTYFKAAENNESPISCSIYRKDNKGKNTLEVYISEFLAVRLSDTSENIIKDIQGAFTREFN